MKKLDKKVVEKYPLGIDIGTGSIKMVQLVPDVKGYRIEKTAQALIPNTISKDKEKLDLFIVENIKKIFTKGKFRKAKVSLSFPAADVCVRTFTIPSIPEKEKDSLPDAIKWASKKYIAQPLEDMVLAYSLGEEIEENKIKKTTVVLVAVHKSIFRRYVDLIKKSGLELTVATVSCFALKNIIAEDENSKNKALALIDIGHAITDITILSNDALVFTRNISEGNKSLDEAIKVFYMVSDKKLDLKPDQIAEFKSKFGIVAEDSDADYCGIKAVEVSKAVAEHSDRIIRELQLSISHYRQLSHGSRIEEIVLTGGGASLKNLEKVISEKTNIVTDIIKQPKSLISKKPLDFSMFAIAVGSALETGLNPNLMQNIDRLSKEKILQIKRLIIKVSVLGVSAFICIVLVLCGMNWYRQKQLNGLEKQFKSLGGESASVQKMNMAAARLTVRKGLLEKFSFPEDSLLKTFVQLNKIINKRNIFVRKIEFTKNVKGKNILFLNAEVQRLGDDGPKEVLNKFLVDLEKIDVFMSMRPKIIKDRASGQMAESLRFDIECIFKKDK